MQIQAIAACPCGRTQAGKAGKSRSFAACCAPLLQGQLAAPDAEALMRSRYTAYVLGDEAYLRRTWHPDTVPADLTLDTVKWLGLQVLWHKPISDTEAQVAFVARYRHQAQGQRLQETSRFVREQGQWLYHSAVE